MSGYLNSLKDIKRRNTLYTAIVLLSALILLVFAIRAIHVDPVKSDAKSGNSLRFTYLGNITLNKHIRQNNLNDVFAGIQDTLKNSDFSSASLLVNEFSKIKR